MAPETRPLVAAAIGLTMSVWYWPGGAVWDDHTLIEGYLTPIPLSDLGRLWSQPVGLGDTGAAYYRPVAMTALSLLGRSGMLGVHVVAGLLHAVSAALVCMLGGRTPAALVGAVVFAVHPLCWEVLGWASALPDALAVALGLTLLVAANRVHPVWILLLACVGMWAKESSLVWVLGGWATGRLTRTEAGAALAGVAVALGVRLGVGVAAVPPSGHIDGVDAWTVFSSQIGTLVWPFPLTAVRDTHHLAWEIWVAGALVIMVAAFAVWRSDRRLRGILLVVLLAPMIALPTTLSAHLAGDRYLYAGVAALGWALSRWTVPIRREGAVLVALTGLGLLIHSSASLHWRSDRALFAQAVEAQPESAYAWHFLGHAHGLRGEWNHAADAFDRARQLPYAHPLSAQLAMQAMVLGEQFEEAAALGRSGPTESLTADWLAWWGRAEIGCGHPDEGARLLLMLRRDDGSFDGPAFVSLLMEQIEESR
ncbi:MAG: hypothetical protein CL927_19070 [Deltaproteobacteria bacterium]|nr:hypothetical protein [Deltaproteobacteria bacterium]HCH66125.1 hypothetical protein [Deltaproteobacteria bacterium]